MAEETGVVKTVVTPRYLDRQKDPPEFVDLELPTRTVKLKGPGRRVTFRAPAGSVEGSYRVTGSHYDLAPGTYSLRVVRISLGVMGEGGAGTGAGRGGLGWRGTVYSHYIRHSRDGTIMENLFGQSEQRHIIGDPLKPILAVGPGTLFYAFRNPATGGMGTRVTFSAQIEGILG